MKKRSPSKTAHSREEVVEAVKARRYDIAGVFQPDADEVSRLLQQFESLDYVAFPDFLRLMITCEQQMMEKVQSLESTYATGVPFESVRALLLSLLRIPPVQRSFSQSPDDRVQTAEEMGQLRENVRAAAKIAREVDRAIGKDGTPPSFEQVNRMIQETPDSAGVRRQLEAARDGDPPITLGNHQQLPAIVPMPKTLLSESRFVVEIAAGGLLDSSSDAEVTLIRLPDADTVPAVFQGLLGTSMRATFVSDKRGKTRRALLGAQLTKRPIRVQVEVTRSFSARHSKLNTLTICKLEGNLELPAAVEEVVTQLKLDLTS